MPSLLYIIVLPCSNCPCRVFCRAECLVLQKVLSCCASVSQGHSSTHQALRSQAPCIFEMRQRGSSSSEVILSKHCILLSMQITLAPVQMQVRIFFCKSQYDAGHPENERCMICEHLITSCFKSLVEDEMWSSGRNRDRLCFSKPAFNITVTRICRFLYDTAQTNSQASPACLLNKKGVLFKK